MEDIYIILSKHFSGASNSEEDRQVAEFREANPVEFAALHKLWQKGKIEIHDFNSEKAWKSIKEKSEKKNTREMPFYSNIRKIAAAIAILIVGSVVAYFLYMQYGRADLIVAENVTNAPVNIELTDGSSVWLSKNAVLTYPLIFQEK